MGIPEDAISYIKSHKKDLIERFCRLADYPRSLNPFTMFMAGCPGAGKTEFSKSIIPELQKKDPQCRIVRIDADEIRSMIPQFNGSNAHEVQGASAIGVEKIFDHVHNHGQNCIVDGTFAKYPVAHRDVVRSLNKYRKVGIFYLYLEPESAWDFTKKRDAVVKRNIPKEAFIEAFFAAKENVIKIKNEFREKIELNVIIKNKAGDVEKTLFNVPTVDKKLGAGYTMGSLQKLLAN